MTDSTGLPRPAGGHGTDVGRRTGDVDVHDGDGPTTGPRESALPTAPADAPAPPSAPQTPAAASPGAAASGATAASPEPTGGPTPAGETDPAPTGRDERRRRRRRIATTTFLVLLVLALGASTVHLYRTSTAWQERADAYLADARGLGDELAATRAALAGTESELDGVRAQLATAQGRIVELADEKAQIGDDREVQRQLVDYQERVSDAAGQVALALDQCVQGQQELIGYLQDTVTDAARYDAAELERFRTDVEDLCQTATEANIALQRELSR
ncbi:hypothetical protein [Actinotalea sp. Marseille-Q4924]|uniref:hypothetical protein n=1 Tax=Actinotalea sp. Marseille-Q4924 TaxID=2866571 RepID=UPI001CE4810B|nr:hypothetical protein [Actinotalea sp. Marseille-Q4924]